MPQASLRLLRALVLATCASLAATTLRTVYIAADEVVWNYAPQGRDMMTNKAVPSLVSATDGSTTTSPGAEPADGHHKSFVSHHHAAGMPDHGASLWLERRPNRQARRQSTLVAPTPDARCCGRFPHRAIPVSSHVPRRVAMLQDWTGVSQGAVPGIH